MRGLCGDGSWRDADGLILKIIAHLCVVLPLCQAPCKHLTCINSSDPRNHPVR